MGIWYWGVLGGDGECELLRDYLEIAGADVPPEQWGAPTVFNEGTERWLLVRHDEEWYVKLRRAYRNADPSRVEAAYPRLLGRARATARRRRLRLRHVHGRAVRADGPDAV